MTFEPDAFFRDVDAVGDHSQFHFEPVFIEGFGLDHALHAFP